MRSAEERVTELHKRMDTLKRHKKLRSYRLQSAVCAAGLGIAVAAACFFAKTTVQSQALGQASLSASIFTSHVSIEYVVVALLAFCLGALVTVFCFRLRRHMEEKDNARNL